MSESASLKEESAPSSISRENPEHPLQDEDQIKESLVLFDPGDQKTSQSSLKTVLTSYRAKEFQTALSDLKIIQSHLTGKEAEFAAFLEGDLYMQLSKDGEDQEAQQALSSFNEAMIHYQKSPYTVTALWKIGNIYAKRKLYYEAIGSFKRILSRYPDHPYALKAKIGIAQTYSIWEKWKEALPNYIQLHLDINKAPLQDQPGILAGLAESLFHLGQYEEAYKSYEEADNRFPNYLGARSIYLFHYAETSYQYREFKKTKELFIKYINVFPRDPYALTAFARLENLFWAEGKEKDTANLKDLALAPYFGPIAENLTRFMDKISEIRSRSDKKSPPVSFHSPLVREIGKTVSAILEEPSSSIAVPFFLFIEAEQIKDIGIYPVALEIEGQIILLLPASPLTKEMKKVFTETVSSLIKKEKKELNPMNIAEIYYSFPSIFPENVMRGSVGMDIATAHAQMGLFSKSIAFYEAVPSTLFSTRSDGEEPLFLYATSLFEEKQYDKARRKLELLMTAFPKSPYLPPAVERMGDIDSLQNKYSSAEEEYKKWLSLFPGHSDRGRILSKLAGVYEKQSHPAEAVKIYLSLMTSSPKNDSKILSDLGEDYYRMGEYEKAAEVFVKSLGLDHPAQPDWTKLRLAQTYEALKRFDKEKNLLIELSGHSDNEIIKKYSNKKMSELEMKTGIKKK
ncbi:MAG: tetratricopeptide repeat protein [Nitrospirae bacterium]|nr:tetratricopeptide repeat protein [Nitrospirota bacterium]